MQQQLGRLERLLLNFDRILQANQVDIEVPCSSDRDDDLLLQHRRSDFFVRLRNGDIAGVVPAPRPAPERLSNKGIGIRVRERNRAGAPRVKTLHEIVDTELERSSRAEALGQKGITNGIVGYSGVSRRPRSPGGGHERDCRVTPQPAVAAQQLSAEARYRRSTGILSRSDG